jgi:hypothetical protein
MPASPTTTAATTVDGTHNGTDNEQDPGTANDASGHPPAAKHRHSSITPVLSTGQQLRDAPDVQEYAGVGARKVEPGVATGGREQQDGHAAAFLPGLELDQRIVAVLEAHPPSVHEYLVTQNQLSGECVGSFQANAWALCMRARMYCWHRFARHRTLQRRPVVSSTSCCRRIWRNSNAVLNMLNTSVLAHSWSAGGRVDAISLTVSLNLVEYNPASATSGSSAPPEDDPGNDDDDAADDDDDDDDDDNDDDDDDDDDDDERLLTWACPSTSRMRSSSSGMTSSSSDTSPIMTSFTRDTLMLGVIGVWRQYGPGARGRVEGRPAGHGLVRHETTQNELVKSRPRIETAKSSARHGACG